MKKMSYRALLGLAGILLIALAGIILTISGCQKTPESRNGAKPPGGIVEQVDDIAVLRLEAPAFAELSVSDRIAAYYLSQAVRVGRDISWDQIHARNLEVRKFLEEIGLNISYGAKQKYTKLFWIYMKKLWIHNGFYDLLSLEKLIPPIKFGDLAELAFVALSNTGGKLGNFLEVNSRLRWMADSLLNSEIDPVLFDKQHSQDRNGFSPLNFYRDVNLEEAAKFPARNPLNSVLQRRNGKIVELVCRTGDDNLAPGPYAKELEDVIENLERARPYLSQERIEVVDHLIKHFRTGSPTHYEAAQMLQNSSETELDFILGFDDLRFDPLGTKGLWTGLLFIKDETSGEKIGNLQKSWNLLISEFPGYDADIFPEFKGNISTVQLLTGVGAEVPICPDVYYYPHGIDSEIHDTRILVFTNVISSRAHGKVVNELNFCRTEEEGTSAQLFAAELAFTKAIIDIFIKDECCSEINRCKGDEERLLKEAQKHLSYLWFITNPKSIDAGVVSTHEAIIEANRRFVRRYSIHLRSLDTELENLPERSIRLIGNYLHEKEVLATKTDEAISHFIIANHDRFREKIGDLAREVSNLLSTKSRTEITTFIDKYSPKVTPSKTESRARSRGSTSTFSREAFILPEIQADINSMGGIDDAHLYYPGSLAEQMYDWGGWRVEEKDLEHIP